MQATAERIRAALSIAVDRLLAERDSDGCWRGRLSSSALATATAVSALAVSDRKRYGDLIRAGAAWLAADQNTDGGWGDSPDSPSNLATTMLAVAALTLCGDAGNAGPLARADQYVTARAGTTADERAAAIAACYGRDRTFAVPILTNCALAGLVPWEDIPRLPFELAVFPHRLYRFLRLHVVSYALPALIAIGIDLHRRRRGPNSVVRTLLGLAERPTLHKLAAIQPASGGFLEAVPLTSFVTMTLADAGLATHPVTRRCLGFIEATARPDGSWPIDTDLSVWLTTNAVLALDAAKTHDANLGKTRSWLAAQQHVVPHPYTSARPGAWAWTDRPGGVPDADDTARAVLALHSTGGHDAIPAAADWLLGLQNRDGGWPTFCRGWGKLPFDQSAPDLTAHVLLALDAAPQNGRVRRAIERGLDYLRKSRRADGSWLPLWFGNQLAPDGANPVLGTAAVLPVLLRFSEQESTARAVDALLAAQNEDDGWGGARGVESSVEETAVVVSALAQVPGRTDVRRSMAAGAGFLVGRVEGGSWPPPSPIGLYFSKLWYSEQLYPIIWTVEALGRALRSEMEEDNG